MIDEKGLSVDAANLIGEYVQLSGKLLSLALCPMPYVFYAIVVVFLNKKCIFIEEHI